MKNSLLILVTGTLIISCSAHKVMETKVEKEIQQVVVAEPDDVVAAARSYIKNSPNLNEKQKLKLIGIENKAIQDIDNLKSEILKTRMVLVKSAFKTNYNANEIELLKNKLLTLERKKIRTGLNAFTEARNVIDPKQMRENDAMYKVFLHDRLSPF